MAYFDNNATTPLAASALDSLHKALEEEWSNPSSPYRKAARVRAGINRSREQIAETLGVEPSFLTFTSGATEANNAVFSYFSHQSSSDSKVLISSIEHPSVSSPAKWYFSDRVDFLEINGEGTVCLEGLEAALQSQHRPILVSLLAASNETGVLQPWKEAAKMCKGFGVHFHCDSTQWLGKLPADDFSLCSTFVSSGHKFGSPKGIGWMVGQDSIPFFHGGSQEGGRRGGTENYPAIEALCSAWQRSQMTLAELPARSQWRDSFESTLLTELPGLRVLGGKSPRLWNTSCFVVPEFENLRWVGKLDRLGFEVSTGSACSSGKDELSPSASAFSLSSDETRRIIRVSSYIEQEQKDWKELANAFIQAFEELSREASTSTVISI